MKRVRVALITNRIAAEPIREHLRSAGIPAEIHDESWLARLWFVSRLSAGVRVEVPAPLANRAEEILLAWDATQDALRAAIRCRACGSLEVDYPQFTQKSLFTNLAIGLVAGLGLVEKDYYCEHCHFMWPKPGAASRRARGHMAPNYFLEETRPMTQPEDGGAEVEPTGTRVGRCWSSANGKSQKTRTNTARFQRFKSWGKAWGITLSIGATFLLLGNSASLGAADTGVPSNGTKMAEAAASGEGNNEAVLALKKGSAHKSAPTYVQDVLPILMGKCARCHDDQTRFLEKWLDYGAASAKRWEIKRRVWDSWRGAYFKQPMPTGNSPEAEAISEEERLIIKAWVENGAPRGVLPTSSGLQTKAERIEHGKQLFATICAACHQPTGLGIPGRFPPLAGSDFLNADKRRAIKIVVNGLQGEVVVNGQRFNNSMPKFPLGDRDIANALTYVYNAFGNSGKEVTPEEVSALRAEKEESSAVGTQTAKIAEEKNPYE